MNTLHNFLILVPLIAAALVIWAGCRVAEARERKRQLRRSAMCNHPSMASRRLHGGPHGR